MKRFYNDDDRNEEEEIDDENMSPEDIINIVSVDDVIHDQKLALILQKSIETAQQDMWWRFRSLPSRLQRIKKVFKAFKSIMEMEPEKE